MKTCCEVLPIDRTGSSNDYELIHFPLCHSLHLIFFGQNI